MAEAIGLISSLYGLFQGIERVVKYGLEVKQAPAEIERLMNEVNTLHPLLKRLDALAKDSQDTTLLESASRDKLLFDCQTQLKELDRKLIPPPGRARKILARIKSPFAKKDTQDHILKLLNLLKLLDASLNEVLM